MTGAEQSSAWSASVLYVSIVHEDPGDRIGNNFRPLMYVIIKSDCEWKLMQRRCQSNKGGLLHTVK